MHAEWWIVLEGALTVAPGASAVLHRIVVIDWTNLVVDVCVFLVQKRVGWHFFALTPILDRERVFLHTVRYEAHQDLAWIVSCAHVGQLFAVITLGRAELPFWRGQLLKRDEVVTEALSRIRDLFRVLGQRLAFKL